MESQAWDLHCEQCDLKDQKELGCKKPGWDLDQQGAPFRFGSPLLGAMILQECPTGLLLREAPWTWEAMNFASFFENASPDSYSRASRFLRRCIGVINNEKQRMREEQKDNKQVRHDAAFGARVRRHHG